eukprot:1195226-Prorocentrum_minimum.AAC.9
MSDTRVRQERHRSDTGVTLDDTGVTPVWHESDTGATQERHRSDSGHKSNTRVTQEPHRPRGGPHRWRPRAGPVWERRSTLATPRPLPRPPRLRPVVTPSPHICNTTGPPRLRPVVTPSPHICNTTGPPCLRPVRGAVARAEVLHHAVDARDVVVGGAYEGEEALHWVLPHHARAREVRADVVEAGIPGAEAGVEL